jgi:hypothetical protein
MSVFSDLIKTIKTDRAEDLKIAREALEQEEESRKAKEAEARTQYFIGVFRNTYGAVGEEVKRFDEAFFALLKAGRHDVIAEVILARPEFMLDRSHRIKTFFDGEGLEYVFEDGQPVLDSDGRQKTVPFNFPKAPADTAKKVAVVLGDLYAKRILAIWDKNNKKVVGDDYWALKGAEAGVRGRMSEDAQIANDSMHGLLNLAQGLKDKEDSVEFATMFLTVFGRLPKSVHGRVWAILHSPEQHTQVKSYNRPHVVNSSGESRPRQDRKTNGKKPILKVEKPAAVRPSMTDQLAKLNLRTPEDHEAAQIEEGRKLSVTDETSTVN